MSSSNPTAQPVEVDQPMARGFRLDPVHKVVAILKDLVNQSRPIDPRLLHCCLSLLAASPHMPLGGGNLSTPAITGDRSIPEHTGPEHTNG